MIVRLLDLPLPLARALPTALAIFGALTAPGTLSALRTARLLREQLLQQLLQFLEGIFTTGTALAALRTFGFQILDLLLYIFNLLVQALRASLTIASAAHTPMPPMPPMFAPPEIPLIPAINANSNL